MKKASLHTKSNQIVELLTKIVDFPKKLKTMIWKYVKSDTYIRHTGMTTYFLHLFENYIYHEIIAKHQLS